MAKQGTPPCRNVLSPVTKERPAWLGTGVMPSQLRPPPGHGLRGWLSSVQALAHGQDCSQFRHMKSQRGPHWACSCWGGQPGLSLGLHMRAGLARFRPQASLGTRSSLSRAQGRSQLGSGLGLGSLGGWPGVDLGSGEGQFGHEGKVGWFGPLIQSSGETGLMSGGGHSASGQHVCLICPVPPTSMQPSVPMKWSSACRILLFVAACPLCPFPSEQLHSALLTAVPFSG